jgi:hypothetical protein
MTSTKLDISSVKQLTFESGDLWYD